MSNLTSRTWWRDAGLRALNTAIQAGVPYLGATVIADVPWITALLAAGLAAVLSLATSIAGLPEASGVNLPWWLAATERVTKTFAQALAAGLVATGAAANTGDGPRVVERRPILRVSVAGEPADVALVDVVTTAQSWLGARAIWDPAAMRLSSSPTSAARPS